MAEDVKDGRMDARLHAAGERWRTAHTSPAQPAPVGGTDAPTDVPVRPPAARRPHRWITLASAAVVLALLVAGGGWLLASRDSSHLSADASGLTGTVWRLSGYRAAGGGEPSVSPSGYAGPANGGAQPVDAATEIYFGRDGSFVGDGECAVAGGTATIGDGTLALHDVVLRPKQCVDQYDASLTPQALPVLRGPATFTIKGTSLQIAKSGGGTLDLTAAPAATPPPTLDVPTLVGANWTLVPPPTTLPSGNGRLPEPPRLHLADDGTYTGSDGCNAFRGTASHSDGLTIRTFTLTAQRTCSGYAGDIAASVDEVLTPNGTLPAPLRASVSGGVLTLTEPGTDTLTYKWQPTETQATDPKLLLGSAWHLALVAGEPAAAPDASLRIGADAKVTVDDGCGTLTGSADVGHGTVDFHGIHGTRCGGQIGDQAVTLDSFLSGRQLWSVRNGNLSINGDEQGFGLVLTPASGEQTPLTGTRWQLSSVVDGNGAAHHAVRPLVLTISKQGRLLADDGANAVDATARIEPGSLVLSGVAVGAVGGTTTDPVTSTVDAVLAPGTLGYRINGDVLTLTRHGAGTLIYRAQHATRPPPSSSYGS